MGFNEMIIFYHDSKLNVIMMLPFGNDFLCDNLLSDVAVKSLLMWTLRVLYLVRVIPISLYTDY